MNRFYPQILMGCSHRSCKFLIVTCWCAGFAGGFFLATDAGFYYSLMRACCDSRVSIVNLLIVPCFPFLISAIAVYFSSRPLLYLCAVVKMFCFGFCLCAVSRSFPGAGLLMCILLLFADILTLPVLCRFQWLGCLQGRKHLFRNATMSLCWFFAVCCVDYLWVMPLLREII